MNCPRISLRIELLCLALMLSFLTFPARLSAGLDHLVISEVYARPPLSAASAEREWVELHNPTASPVDIGDWRLVDDSQHDILPAYTIPPGGYLVVVASMPAFLADHPGFDGPIVSLEGPIGGGLGDSGDRLVVLDGSGALVDAMSYGRDTAGFTPPCVNPLSGHSLARYPPDQDTDSNADWYDESEPTPGSAPRNPNPLPTSTSTATLPSATTQPSSTLTRAPTSTLTPTCTTTSTITPTLGAVFTRTPTASATPSATNTPASGSATPTWTPSVTSAPKVSPTATSSSTPSGTPTPGVASVEPGDVIVNEMMINPAAVPSSRGQWFELYNRTSQAIDLSGWTISDDATDLHVISTDSHLWLPAESYLVFGANADPASNGRLNVDYVYYRDFTLFIDGDQVVLSDARGQEIDRVAYDGTWPGLSPPGASMALLAPDVDNSRASNWHASFQAWRNGAGDFGSPGYANPIPPIGQIEGFVYEDLDGNRHREANEPGIIGVLITLSDGQYVRTLSGGWYGFYGLTAGIYTITESQPQGYESTTPNQLTVTIGQTEVLWGNDFGERLLPSPTPSPTPSPSVTLTPLSSATATPRMTLTQKPTDPVATPTSPAASPSSTSTVGPPPARAHQ